MIDYEVGVQLARWHIEGLGARFTLMEQMTMAKPYGWIFMYTTKLHAETGNPDHMPLGNAPFLVLKQDGEIHDFGTSRPLEAYVADYEQKLKDRGQ